MRFRFNWTAIFAVTTLAACQGGSASLETDDEIVSYGFGLDIGRSLEPTVNHLDRAALARGIEDALDGRDPAISPEQLAEVTQRVGMLIQEEQNAVFEATTESNRAEGEAYLASNAERDDVTVTDSGLQYEVILAGEAGGARPTPVNQVTIHYRGTLIDGTEFDSSLGGLFARAARHVRGDRRHSRIQRGPSTDDCGEPLPLRHSLGHGVWAPGQWT